MCHKWFVCSPKQKSSSAVSIISLYRQKHRLGFFNYIPFPPRIRDFLERLVSICPCLALQITFLWKIHFSSLSFAFLLGFHFVTTFVCISHVRRHGLIFVEWVPVPTWPTLFTNKRVKEILVTNTKWQLLINTRGSCNIISVIMYMLCCQSSAAVLGPKKAWSG